MISRPSSARALSAAASGGRGSYTFSIFMDKIASLVLLSFFCVSFAGCVSELPEMKFDGETVLLDLMGSLDRDAVMEGPSLLRGWEVGIGVLCFVGLPSAWAMRSRGFDGVAGPSEVIAGVDRSSQDFMDSVAFRWSGIDGVGGLGHGGGSYLTAVVLAVELRECKAAAAGWRVCQFMWNPCLIGLGFLLDCVDLGWAWLLLAH